MASSCATPLGKPAIRLLYVDDDPVLVDLAKRKLDALGYSVTGLTDSRQALSLFEKQPDSFDVVVSDLSMPDPSGQALESRMHRFRRDLPFILVSGHDRPYDEDDAGQAGHVECLYKPFRMEELDRCIRQLLGKNG